MGQSRTRFAMVGLGVLLAAGCGSTSTSKSSPTAAPPSQASSTSTVPDPTESPGAPEPSDAPVSTSSALTALAALPVKGRAPKTGYSRDQFGQAWADVDRNGCDTRSDILLATLVDITASGRCTVMSGTLNDPYTGTAIRYVRGGVSEVDIDHVVALANAWQTGAFQFPFAKRVALANDPLNLLAVDASTNRKKGDGDAATFLPTNKSFRCEYVARQIAVKTKYQLWVTAPEADAMKTILGSCPGQTLPAPGPQPTEASNTGSVPAPDTAPQTQTKPSTSGSGSVTYYRVCADAQAAGVTPIRKGTALYDANTHLDRDKDGVACE